jgi:outer membrane receptor protein involved in Fe transport
MPSVSCRSVFFVAVLCSPLNPLTAAESDRPAETPQLGEVTVTGIREAQPRAQETATVDVIDGAQISETLPAHPSEIMERIPGVHVNVTGGEGHMTAIRQPITTSPVYLYLEDGIPTRSTGFFNHNALYEIDLPQADRIEVNKGPGTALYGSDAIGAVINVQTKAPPLKQESEITLEGGEHGWLRLLGSTGDTKGDNGWRGDLNLTHTDGWRDATDYDRYSATLRWDHFTDAGNAFKNILAASKIDQQTAGSSRILQDDYENNPTINYTPISYRKVDALRVSSAYDAEKTNSLFTVTPYARYNTMELLPNWALSYDPTVYETKNYSVGALVKYRKDLRPLRTRLITGVDIDYSPGSYFEQKIDPVKEGRIYTSYTVGETLYDYDVSFGALSPYVHSELSPTDKLRVTAGLRLDYMRYDYDNNLSVENTGSHRRPESTTADYNHLSPKLGLSYLFSDTFNGFIAYRHAFRVPSQNQLFRQGRAENTVDLQPVKADNIETGIRGNFPQLLNYELSVYYLTKRDDILTYEHPDRTRETMNAGKTLHRGVEVGLHTPTNKPLSLSVSYSYAKHNYEDWKPSDTVDYSGNEMSSAPREIANTRLNYRAKLLQGANLELEWVHLGSYWMDDANTHKYPGHDVFNIRGNLALNKTFQLFARIMNITNKRYATSSAYKPPAFGKPEQFEYAPGMPRTVYAGIRLQF